MSNHFHKDGGPAFPMHPDMVMAVEKVIIAQSTLTPTAKDEALQQLGESCTGMSLRDWFAGRAMQGMMARDTFDPGQGSPTQRARLAYIEADAMLQARSAAPIV